MIDTLPPGPAWIPTFLAALADTLVAARAIKAAGITTNAAYYQRRNNLAFADAWDAALGRPPRRLAVAAATPEPAPETAAPRVAGWRTPFLESLAETSNVAASALGANVPTRTVYKARREEAEFAAKWRNALFEGYDNLEMEVLGYLRDPAPTRKMDVAAAMRLLIAHRETVARERALRDDDDEQAVFEEIDAFIDAMRERRATNTAILGEADDDDGAQ